jgi:hypothetical protein
MRGLRSSSCDLSLNPHSAWSTKKFLREADVWGLVHEVAPCTKKRDYQLMLVFTCLHWRDTKAMMIFVIDSNPSTFLLEEGGGVDCGRGRLDHRLPTRQPVLRIHDILVRIWIVGSGSDSGSWYFRQWPSRWILKMIFFPSFFWFLLFEATFT